MLDNLPPAMFAALDTPSVLVDLDIAERNIHRFQSFANKAQITVRPHIKTHKLPDLAKAQIKAGAVGITCQKISEAEVMANAGLDDILITYNILSASKLDRLNRLASKIKLTVVADNLTVIEGLSAAFSNTTPLRVLVECDTGAGRCGVQTPEAACEIAQRINNTAGLMFGGLMTYPPTDREKEVQQWLTDAQHACLNAGLQVDTISTGGTPGMWKADHVPVATEYRPGTYIYNDRSLVTRGTAKWDDCALTVLATVISTPTEKRAIIDAGSKVLTSDLLGMDSYGYVVDHPDLTIHALSEEHGIMLSKTPHQLSVGQRVRIIPNHACVVTNMMDRITLLRGKKIEGEEIVAARGCVT